MAQLALCTPSLPHTTTDNNKNNDTQVNEHTGLALHSQTTHKTGHWSTQALQAPTPIKEKKCNTAAKVAILAVLSSFTDRDDHTLFPATMSGTTVPYGSQPHAAFLLQLQL